MRGNIQEPKPFEDSISVKTDSILVKLQYIEMKLDSLITKPKK
jgi:hypothetical protein